MQIRDHLLVDDGNRPLDYRVSPNHGGDLNPQYLVMHYTAGANFESSCKTLTDPNARVSAHLVIGRGGEVAQLVRFNTVAWHAGVSRWHGLSGLNAHSIGIEMDNAGRLTKANGRWRSWFGKTYADDEVLDAPHRFESTNSGWHLFTPAQIEKAIEISRLLVRAYDLRDVIGHDDIAPGRKSDPGPAFPMDSFRSSVIGRERDTPEMFEALADVNLRAGPGTAHDKLASSPLKRGTRFTLHSREGVWCYVDVLNADGRPDANGWVHGDYIKPV